MLVGFISSYCRCEGNGHNFNIITVWSPGFVTTSDHCSKCWCCCLSKLDGNNCKPFNTTLRISLYPVVSLYEDKKLLYLNLQWRISQELIRGLKTPAVFTDYCEEAAHLAARCLSSTTSCQLALPVSRRTCSSSSSSSSSTKKMSNI